MNPRVTYCIGRLETNPLQKTPRKVIREPTITTTLAPNLFIRTLAPGPVTDTQVGLVILMSIQIIGYTKGDQQVSVKSQDTYLNLSKEQHAAIIMLQQRKHLAKTCADECVDIEYN